MSVGDNPVWNGAIYSDPGICESCRHTARNCPQCGGWEQYPAPPAPPEKRCLRCVSKIAASGDVSAILDPVGMRMAWMSLQGYSQQEITESIEYAAPNSMDDERAQYDAAWRMRDDASPDEPTEILTLGDELLLLDGESTTVSKPAKLVTLPEVLDIPPGKVLPLPQGYAVTQLPPTWRSLLTDCAVLLKAIAEKDEAAATEHVRQFNELLTRAAQYGS